MAKFKLKNQLVSDRKKDPILKECWRYLEQGFGFGLFSSDCQNKPRLSNSVVHLDSAAVAEVRTGM